MAEISTETGSGFPEAATINVNLFKLISHPIINGFCFNMAHFEDHIMLDHIFECIRIFEWAGGRMRHIRMSKNSSFIDYSNVEPLSLGYFTASNIRFPPLLGWKLHIDNYILPFYPIVRAYVHYANDLLRYVLKAHAQKCRMICYSGCAPSKTKFR